MTSSARAVQWLSEPPARRGLEEEIDAEVRELLTRISAQERLADGAQAGLGRFFGWPSWSMDTGLTPAQERFVEHWSPQRVLEASRMLRELVGVLQRWTRAQGDDDSLDAALALLTTLRPR